MSERPFLREIGLRWRYLRCFRKESYPPNHIEESLTFFSTSPFVRFALISSLPSSFGTFSLRNTRLSAFVRLLLQTRSSARLSCRLSKQIDSILERHRLQRRIVSFRSSFFSDFFSDHNSPVSLSFVALLLGHNYQYHDFESITKSRKSSCRGSENILQNRAPLKGAVPPTTPPASFQRLRRTLHRPRLPQYTNILHPFPLQVALHPLQVPLTHPFVRVFYTRSLLLRRQLPLTLPQTMILSRAPCPDDVFKSEHLASSQREGALLRTNDATAELSHFPKRLSLTTPPFRLTSET